MVRDPRTVHDPCRLTMHMGKRFVFVDRNDGLMRNHNFDWALADGALVLDWNGDSKDMDGQLVDSVVVKLDFVAAVGLIVVETVHLLHCNDCC